MKLTVEELDFIQGVIKTANSLDVAGVIIEPGKVRAMDEDQTIFLFQDKGIPPMQFGSIALNRLDAFSTRLEITRAQPNFEIEVVTTGTNATLGYDKYDAQSSDAAPMWVRAINMKADKINLDYRCANPMTVKAPKNRAGANVYSISITPELLVMLQKGKNAMKSKEVKLIGNKKGATIEISDINSDTLSYHFNDTIQCHNGDEPNFSYTYIIDDILPILKTNPTGTFSLTARGSLRYTVNGLDVYFMSHT